MFSILRKSLSGSSQEVCEDAQDPAYPDALSYSDESNDSTAKSSAKKGQQDSKTPKRNRSGGGDGTDGKVQSSSKKKKLAREQPISESEDDDDDEQITCHDDVPNKTKNPSSRKPEALPNLPSDTPDWGLRLLEIMQSVANTVTKVQSDSKGISKSVKDIECKLSKVEEKNRSLEKENVNPKENRQ